MNLQAFDANVITGLDHDKQNIFRQLCDMFHGTPLGKIRAICEESLWNVELCIDKLVTCDNNNDTVRQSKQLNPDAESFAMVMHKKKGAVPKGISTVASTSQPRQNGPNLPQVYANCYENIKKGYKVFIVMRGPPGCGKSYLAKLLIEKLFPGRDKREFILSADDYFMDSLGRYKYNRERLEDAHVYCQTRAREKASLGWSPIIIDNTNIQLWEMIPYIQTAVRNGYIIELMEPQTPWRYSAGKLASKNSHGVMKGPIQRMLDNYEYCRNEDVLRLLKDTKYTVSLPQLRTYPPPPAESPPPPPEQTASQMIISTPMESTNTGNTMETDINPQIEETEKAATTSPERFPVASSSWLTTETDENNPRPRSPRQNRRNKQQEEQLEPQDTTECTSPNAADTQEKEPTNFWGIPMSNTSTDNKLLSNAFPSVPVVWNDYDKEASTFWGVPITTASTHSTNIEPMSTDQNEDCGLLQLLKEGVRSINVPPKEAADEPNPLETPSNELKRHRVGCENENPSFILFRQIYSNKSIADLWDLFATCKGDVDWAVDILLKDSDTDNVYCDVIDSSDTYQCDCNNPDAVVNVAPTTTNVPLVEINVKPQRQRPPKNRIPNADAMLVKETIEKRFVLGQEHYSSQMKKARAKRNAEENGRPRKQCSSVQIQTEDDYNDNDNENNDSDESGDGAELLEINLGEHLVGQLMDIFKSENPTVTVPEKYKTNVFMPKSIARELYVLWMESMYNQMEEQRQLALKDDEDFARLLKNPKYEECKQPPDNIKELLDMEYAWMVYNTEKESCRPLIETQPNDLASHLTRMKLCEIFPNIPRETLLEILAAHNNKFSETVEVLKSSIPPTVLNRPISAKVLLEQANNENDKLSKEAESQEQVQIYPNNGSAAQIHSKGEHEGLNSATTRSRSISPDEAKRLALKEFEECRNYAAHHCQLRAECYQKSKEAIQRGNSGVALYYSQIANLHKKKIDIYNHKAANCIVEVHNRTQNNPDFIDLHYLHVVEAIACLDIFIDKHIAKLRSIFRSFKYVFIITGRGLHSTGGISTIKTRVKSRLKERNLKWSEVNPGLLKVKIFSASKFAKNL